MIMIWIWVAVIVISAIIEAFSLDMTSIWITCGGIIALIITIFAPVAYIWQILSFILITALCIIFLRPITKKIISKKTIATNASSLIGQKARLIEKITETSNGTIKINDIIWSTKSENGEIINSGELVEVIKITGNKLIVKKFNEEKENNN